MRLPGEEGSAIIRPLCRETANRPEQEFFVPGINPLIFREYDIRGVVGSDLTTGVVETIGGALGTHLGGAQGAAIAIGRDNRFSSPDFYDALQKGLTASGCRVIGIGMAPTPVVSFATHHLDVAGAVQITGSHNPPEFNGFKITRGREAIHGAEIQTIRKIIEEGRIHRAETRGTFEEIDIRPQYIERASKDLTLSRPVKVVVDAGNGVGGTVAPQVLRNIGAEVVELFTEPDGSYPNHHPDPTVPKNLESLIAKVRETGAEVGIGLDGDGDRIGAVDATGRIIWGDELLILLAAPILARCPGEAIVFDVKCSSRLADAVKQMGGRPVMSATGHSLVRAKIAEEKSPLGGELSGHIFFVDDYLGYDDAIYTAARLLHLLCDSGETLAERVSKIPDSVSTPEIRVACPDEEKFEIVENLKNHFKNLYETIEVDGARINFEKGWGLIRASNTQPVLVMRFEALDEPSLHAYQSEVYEEIKKYPAVSLPDA